MRFMLFFSEMSFDLIALIFGSDVCGAKRMNSNDLGESSTEVVLK